MKPIIEKDLKTYIDVYYVKTSFYIYVFIGATILCIAY
jgi:hypothetical protein